MADLKAFRKANRLTQEQVAGYLGVSKTFICNIEKGINKFPKEHLYTLLNNSNGWDTSLLSELLTDAESEQFAEALTTDTPPTDAPADVMVISQQVLEEMSAQRQLAEQALAVAQDQLAVTNEALLNAQRNLAHEQQQVTEEQKQVTTSQSQLTVEQEHTRHMIAQVDELIMMLKKSEIKLEREMEKMERRIEELANKQLEHDDEREHKPHKTHSHNNDA